MAVPVFVGRRRHPVKIALYSILTLGIYGRVFVYRTIRELDGHEVLFLDHKTYRFLLLLPLIGPLIAKWRLVGLLPVVLRHDVAAKPVHLVGLRWAALIPLFPVFHVLVQRHLNPHWALHRKLDDLEAMKGLLEDLRKSRRKDDQGQAAEWEERIQRQEEELENRRQAALALRAAREARRRAEDEIRKAGARSPWKLGNLPFVRGRRTEPAEEPEPPESAPEEAPKRRFGLLKARAASPEATAQAVGKKTTTGPDAPAAQPTRAERRALRKAEKQRRKEEKRRAKLLEKEHKAQEKAARKAARQPAPAAAPDAPVPDELRAPPARRGKRRSQ